MQTLNSKILLNCAIFLVLCQKNASEGVGDGAHKGSPSLEQGSFFQIGTTEITIGVQDVLAVERQLQVVAVAVFHTEVEKHRSIHIEVGGLLVGIVQFPAFIRGVAIELELVVGYL